ncbi:hypothetical protein HXX76_010472 [Chlamydomonas incerta]|uniref:Uncharacterized protein n=1 Tax=Chlamydomonas incerta TaxID=51695 RepID=A0A835VWQ1_CHLIN|nr:hypothetical protein HXX76_010472 [Chlamydomonas incerta]|eukprot:KAG2428324.1 hypothetical protein HXX76_010472 [Chlamydomonas incerta]
MHSSCSSTTSGIWRREEEVLPLRQQFVSNAVHRVAKLVRSGSASATTRGRNRPATAGELQALAAVVEMSAGELAEGLNTAALLRNEDAHPGGLESLRFVVQQALQACGEEPRDAHLAFARRFFSRLPQIEKAFLRMGVLCCVGSESCPPCSLGMGHERARLHVAAGVDKRSGGWVVCA